MKKYKTQFVDSITEIDINVWNQLCEKGSPFLRYEFLFALEKSGCTTISTGWQPHHLIITDSESALSCNVVAVMPLYVKTHSYGEYVFDWAWADAYQRYGHAYYPKLITAIPFTPATGCRIGILKNSVFTEIDVIPSIVQAIKTEIEALKASSWHCLFPEKTVSDGLHKEDISQRKSSQFHWLNKSYDSFDHFLETFNSRKRKNVKKERKKVIEQGVIIKRKLGKEITEEEWFMFYQFYHLTYFKRSGRQGYLNEEFFKLIASTMPDKMMMVIAYTTEEQGEEEDKGQEKDGEKKAKEKMIAASLFFIGNDVLYGRYWGCSEEYEFLHFEACYYQGIEFAIEKQLKKFDPGAQGEHKIQRGFTPVATWSNHWIARDDFRDAINDFLKKEAIGVDHYIQDCKNYLPFKK
ncbi:MAG: GNAT family N-acetyltransferase [Cellvibrionaceae bacterium]